MEFYLGFKNVYNLKLEGVVELAQLGKKNNYKLLCLGFQGFGVQCPACNALETFYILFSLTPLLVS